MVSARVDAEGGEEFLLRFMMRHWSRMVWSEASLDNDGGDLLYRTYERLTQLVCYDI